MGAGAQAIVTLDVADFRSAVLTSAGIRVVTPGTLLDELLDTEPGLPAAAIGDLAARWVRPTRTVDEILDLLAQHAGVDGGYSLARSLALLADILRVAGHTGGAEQRAREALEVAERVGSPRTVAWSRLVLGRVTAAHGAWSEAEALLHQALEQLLEIGDRLWLPRTLDALAEVAAGLESHEEAARLLGAVNRAHADLGIVRWAPDQPHADALEQILRGAMGDVPFEKARSEGADLPLEEAIAWCRRARGSRKRPSGGWEALTPTEAAVVELVVQGLTNPQIAKRMFISSATVKVHLSHVFQKLGVNTRAQLAARAARRSS